MWFAGQVPVQQQREPPALAELRKECEKAGELQSGEPAQAVPYPKSPKQ